MEPLFTKEDLRLFGLIRFENKLMVSNPLFATDKRHLFFPIGLFDYFDRVRPVMLVRANGLEAWEIIDLANDATKVINLQDYPLFQKFTVFFVCFNYELEQYAGQNQFSNWFYVEDIIPVVKAVDQFKELEQRWPQNSNYDNAMRRLAWFLYYNQPDEKGKFKGRLGFRGSRFEIHDENWPPRSNDLHELFFE